MSIICNENKDHTAIGREHRGALCSVTGVVFCGQSASDG